MSEAIELGPATEKQPETLRDYLVKLDREGVDPKLRGMYTKQFLSAKARKQRVPILGTFELTPLCNLDCKMCYVHLTKEQLKGAQLLPVDMWKRIMGEAVEAGMMYATLTGGECLTYPGFKELYLYLQSLGVRVTVFTNGVLLDEEYVRFFCDNKPDCIQISVYGSTEEAYEKVTGQSVSGIVMENVYRIQSAGLPLRLVVTPNKFMGDDAKRTVLLVSKIGVPYTVSSSLIDANEDTGRHGERNEMPLDDYIELMRFVHELKGDAIEACRSVLPEARRFANGERRGLRCGAGRDSFWITWNGTMMPCHSLHDCQVSPLVAGFSMSWEQICKMADEYLVPAECFECPYDQICPACVVRHSSGAAKGHANPVICERSLRLVQAGLCTLSAY